MKAEYLQRGEALDYKNGTEAAIPAGSVIELGSRIGVAGTDIPIGGLGSVHVLGVFSMPKKAEEIKMGDALYFDSKSEGGQLTKTGSEGTTPAGYAAADAATTYLLFSLKDPALAELYLDLYCEMSGTEKRYVQRWLPVTAASRLGKEIPEEQALLERWLDVVEYQ